MWMKRIGITATGSVLLLAGIGGAAAATHATSPPVADPTATSGTTASEQPAAREVVNQQTGERESEQVGEQESGWQENG